MNKVISLKHVVYLYAFIFVVWGFYRLFFKLPDALEELILKPILWFIPLVVILKKEKKGLGYVGWTTHNLFRALYLAIGVGILLALEGALVNSIKYGGSLNFFKVIPNEMLFFGALGLSLVTAITEETVFRGFIFYRLMETVGEWKANILTSVLWALVHVPVTIFVLHYTIDQVALYLGLTFLFGAASAFLFARTKNIASSVLLHVFWEWPIILFR